MVAWTLAGSLVTLRREIDAAFPGRSKISDGTLGDAAHAARKSDHNPDARSVVRAFDCTRDVVDGVDVAQYVAEWLRAKKDPRTKYVIFNHQMFSSYVHQPSGTPAWTWRPYSGPNAHEHHVHISVQPYPDGDDARAWGFVVQTATPTPPEEDPLAVPDEAALKAIGQAVWRTGFAEFVDEAGDGKRDVRSVADILYSAHRASVLALAAVAKLGPADVDEAALARELAPLLTSSLAHLPAEQLAQIAVAVADEQARRLAG